MRILKLLLLVPVGLLLCQSGSADKPVITNLATAKFVHEAGDAPGSEGVTLREDPKTGAMELYARYPAGHVFQPHWHSVNERVLLLDGKFSLNGESLDPGAYAFLPAKTPHRLSCVSKTPCTFYIYWDGKLDFHRAQ